MGKLSREGVAAAREARKEINKGPTRAERKEDRGRREETLESFTVDEAMRQPGFADFLAEFGDAETLDLSDDNPVIAERYVMFTEKIILGESLKGVYSEHVRADLGISIDGSVLEEIDVRLSKRAAADPEGFKKALESRRKFEKAAQSVRESQAEIEELLVGIDKTGLETKVEDLELAKSQHLLKRMFSSEARKTREDILKKYDLHSDHLGDVLSSSKTDLETLKKLSAVQKALYEECAEAQKSLFKDEVGPLQQIRKKVLLEVNRELTEIRGSTDPSVENLNKVAATIRKIRASTGTAGGVMNYAKGLEADLDTLEQELKINTERVVQVAIENVSKSMTKRTLTEVEVAINATMSKMTKDGLDSPENRALFVRKIEDLANAEKDMAKKLLLRRMAIKLKK